MRNTILMLLLAAAPAVTFAQKLSAPPQLRDARTEIGLKGGGGVSDLQDPQYLTASGAAALSLFRNWGRFQAGLQLEGNTFHYNEWALSTIAVGNYRFLNNHGYWYAGASAGYTRDIPWGAFRNSMLSDRSQGYLFGLQAGYVRHLGNHFSFTTELAVRSRQTWDTYYDILPEYAPGGIYAYGCYIETYDYKVLTTSISVPVTIGLRYRF